MLSGKDFLKLWSGGQRKKIRFQAVPGTNTLRIGVDVMLAPHQPSLSVALLSLVLAVVVWGGCLALPLERGERT